MTAPSQDPRVVSTTGMPADAGEPEATGRGGALDAEGDHPPYDPLKLCIFATIALLGWLGGPVTLLVFAVLGVVGYARARRAGLRFSKCFLRDTRLVLLYLSLLALAAGWGIVQRLG